MTSRIFLVLTAVLAFALLAQMIPHAHARVCTITLTKTTCDDDPPAAPTQAELNAEAAEDRAERAYQAEQAVKVSLLPGWNVTRGEFNCLLRSAQDDAQSRLGMAKSPSFDPIAECRVADTRTAAAMDILIELYNDRHEHGLAATWVESHCEAKPAIPHNKWVCTENSVTREYR
jgi:hypothetical protein